MSEKSHLYEMLKDDYKSFNTAAFFDEYLNALMKILRTGTFLPEPGENAVYIDNLEYKSEDKHRNFINFLLKTLHDLNETTETDIPKLKEYANTISDWIINKQDEIPGKINEIIENREVLYQNYIARSKYITNEYQEPIYKTILLLPDLFYLYCHIIENEKIDRNIRFEISLSLLYLVSPIDLLPENFINHPLSLIDDLFLMLSVFDKKAAIETNKICHCVVSAFFNEVDSTLDYIEDMFGENSVRAINEILRSKHNREG